MNGKGKTTVEPVLKDPPEDFNVSGWGTRHSQCVIMFFALTVAYSMRSCMGVALVAMVQKENIVVHQQNYTFNIGNETDLDNGSFVSIRNDEDLEVTGFFNALMLSPPYPKFNWTKKTQDVILSSFFWGYMALQIPAGQLAHRFGPRRLLVGALTLNCIIPMVMPIVTYYGGWICAILCRIGQGMSQACIIPGFHTFFGKWTPLQERSRLTSMVYGGQAIGTVLGLPITGFIASSFLGWPGLFRFYGILSGIIAVVLMYQLADSPAQHKTISYQERKYIEEDLGQRNGQEYSESMLGVLTIKISQYFHVTFHITANIVDVKALPVPWKKILTSRGMLAIVFAHISNTWGQLTLFSELPSYMDKVMGVNLKANGLLTALPFMVMWLTNFFFSWLTDMLIVKKYLSVTNARKVATSLGYIPSSIGFLALAYAPRNIYVIETILVLICGFKIAAHVGFYVNTPINVNGKAVELVNSTKFLSITLESRLQWDPHIALLDRVNHVDISPNYAGTMISISNFMANLFGSIAPLVAGFILTDPTDPALWGNVFLVASGLYFFTNLIYVVLGTGKLAEWNDPQYEKVALDEKSGSDEKTATTEGHHQV